MEKIDELNRLYSELLRRGTVHNKTQLSEKTGINKSNLSAAFGGNAKYLTDGLLTRISALLNNEGQESGESYRIPLLPIEAHAGSLAEFADAISNYDCEMVVSPVRGASFAVQVTGDSMAPAYPSGARILCQKVDESAFIEWGRVYLLDTVNGAILKQVRKSDKPGCVTCCSLNPAPEYAPFDISTEHILGWYRVLLIMSLV